MTAYIIRRLIQAVVILIIITFLVFLAMRLMPGDPILLYLAGMNVRQLPPEKVEELRHEFGLDRPLLVQYVDWAARIFTGDLGKSIFYRTEVRLIIGRALPITAHMGILAILISSVLGIALGIVSAVKRGKWLDTGAVLLANVGITVPVFWLGIMLIYLISYKLGLLPVFGYTSPFEDFWLSTRQVILPVMCLVLFPLAATARQTRSSMLEVVRQDYVRTAWAKGLRERIIIQRHVLKNGLIPVITLIGVDVGAIIGGQVLIETVFNIPGIGRMLVTALFAHDYSIVQGGILVIAVAIVLSNLIVDLSYAWLDPRIRYE
ncbi:Dipeptide transport system permease protein DppB [subsurface metagenome]